MPDLPARPASRSGASPLAAALGLALALGGCGTGSAILDGGALDKEAAASAISRYRAQHGLGPVVLDASLIRAASLQAAANARAGRLSHDLGGGFTERMAQAGFGKRFAAENLSAGSESFDQVLARWKVSPEHNRNMLMPQLRRIGVARADNPDSRYKRYWALVLAGD